MALGNHDHGGTDEAVVGVLNLPNWRWGRQVARAAAESPEATMGDEEGSTGCSLGRQGGGRGRGHKRKASREAVPLGDDSAARTGDEGCAASSAPPECDSDNFSACRNRAATNRDVQA
jgi:hypothetical protein